MHGEIAISLSTLLAIFAGCIVFLVVLYMLCNAGRLNQRRRLQQFLSDIDNNEFAMRPSWDEAEYDDIKTSVTGVVEEIVYKIFSKEDIPFKMDREDIALHVELVGSCREESKIKRPNEFDFLVTLPHFSNTNVEQERNRIRPESLMRCTHGHSLFEENAMLTQLKYVGLYNTNKFIVNINNTNYISAYAIHSFFKQHANAIFTQMCLDLYIVSKPTGVLTMLLPDQTRYNSEESGPAWTLKLHWHNASNIQFKISVDIVLTIAFETAFDHLDLNNSVKDKYLRSLQTVSFVLYPALSCLFGNDRYSYSSDHQRMRGGIYRLTYDDLLENLREQDRQFSKLTFLISLAKQEHTLMQKIKTLNYPLFTCYKILKGMRNLRMSLNVEGHLHELQFSSYILKTIILKEFHAGRLNHQHDLAMCFKILFKELIQQIESCIIGDHVTNTSFWCDDYVLTCISLPKPILYREYYQEAFRQQFDQLNYLLNEVIQDQNYRYSKYKEAFRSIIKASRVVYRVPAD